MNSNKYVHILVTHIYFESFDVIVTFLGFVTGNTDHSKNSPLWVYALTMACRMTWNKLENCKLLS